MNVLFPLNCAAAPPVVFAAVRIIVPPFAESFEFAIAASALKVVVPVEAVRFPEPK